MPPSTQFESSPAQHIYHVSLAESLGTAFSPLPLFHNDQANGSGVCNDRIKHLIVKLTRNAKANGSLYFFSLVSYGYYI